MKPSWMLAINRHASLWIVALATFLSFILSPLYMAHLRNRLEKALPEEWAKVTMNGPFMYVSPLIAQTRNHEEGLYATRLTELMRYGFPYCPHTGDHSLKEWIFDSLSLYPLAPFAWLAGNDVQKGWILAHAALGTMWVLFFYVVFMAYCEDKSYSLFLATASFFFLDCFLWIFTAILPHLWPPRTLGHMLFHFVARACGQVQFMRLPSPGMTFLWLYAALAGVFVLAVSPRRRSVFSILVGIFIGIMSLSHFYEWVFGVGCLLILFAAGLWLKMPQAGLQNLAIANGLSLPISGAYYFFAQSLTRDAMPDIIARMGVPNHRSFAVGSLLYLALALWFGHIASKRAGEKKWFWIFAAIQNVVVFLSMNLSIILGYEMQFGHFTPIGALTSTIALICLSTEFKPLVQRLRPHWAVMIVAIFAWVFLREKSWSETHFKLFGSPRDVAAAAQWINDHAPKNSLLVSLSGGLNEHFPLVIQMRYPVFNGGVGYGPPRKTQENIDGLAQILKTLRVDSQKFIKERLENHWEWDAKKEQVTYLTRNIAWNEAQRGAWAYFLFALQAGKIHEDGIDEKLTRALTEVPPLRLPYYVWLQREDEAYLRASLASLGGSLVYENSSVRIYHFKDKSES